MAETRQRRTDPHNRYRDRVAPETEEAFGLENVPGLERPMASGPRDTLIGQDELGNLIYRTILGTQYTVKPNPDQRTTRGKVEDWVDEGAPLPSMDQVGEMAAALPGAIYDSAQGALDGTGTLGDAMGFAPVMQAASLPARVPAGALRTGGGRNTENPKYNPLFREEPEEVNPFDTPGDELPTGWSMSGYPGGTEFYNPLRNTVENMDFGRQGLRGETIAAFLEKRAPKVRRSLLRSADSGRGIFQPNQRYTQEEALDILDENFGKVYVGTTHEFRNFEPQYQGAQRMDFLENKELDYGELTISQDRAVNFRANSQHYDDNTLAHARYSVRDDGAGGEMLVVEELQSDLVQKGFDTDVKGVPGVTFGQAIDKAFESSNLPEVFRDLAKEEEYFIYGNPSEEELMPFARKFDEYRGRPGEVDRELEGLSSEARRDTLIDYVINAPKEVEQEWHDYTRLRRAGRDGTLEGKDPVSLPPIDSVTEYVRPLIHALMVEAKNRGIDKLVIPNSDAFIEARKNQLGMNDADSASTIKAFRNTYDFAVDKVLRELDREMGVDVNIESTTLKGKGSSVNADAVADAVDDSTGMTLDEFRSLSRDDFVAFYSSRMEENYRGVGMEPPPGSQLDEESLRKYVELSSLLQKLDEGASTTNYPSRMITLGNIPKGKIRFAEGGLVEDQMKFAFMNEGGMIDDGATVEPTTGNEVPPGSLKEEVADTIDAKLSVGEYVVPADVVQYYGVAHFEKLRQKAKEGLAQMEANGRIGGDPTEDELPFNDEELMTEDGAEEGPQGFAEGGLAWNSPQMTGLTGTGTETVTYVGPDGTKLPILFLNGQPIQQIPQGYVPEGQQRQAQPSFKSVRPTVSKGEGDSAMNTMQPKSVSEWGVEDFERYSNSQGVMDIVTKLPAILGPGGMIMGGLMNKAYEMQGQQALKEIDNRLSSTELDDQSRQRLQAVKDNLSSRSEESSNQGFLGGGLFNNLTGGNGLMEKLFGGGVQTTAQPTPTRTQTQPASRTTARPTSSGEGSGLAPTTSPRPQARPQTATAPQSQAPKNSTPAQKETYSSSGRNNSQQVSGDPRNGRFAEGGLVKRRNKQ